MTTTVTNDIPVAVPSDELGTILRDYMDVAQRLQQTHETLQQEIIRLRRELASKDRELERRRRLAGLGELAAGIAHEVRNPLGAIQLYSGLLRTQLESGESADQPVQQMISVIDKIEAGIRAIDGVVNDTLALAPRCGKPSSCELRSTIQRAHDVCVKTLRGHKVTLATHCADDIKHVCAEEAGLQRVLVNLIANAAEASPPGGIVTLTVAQRSAEQVELRVSDQGPGIPDEVLDRVFDPFFTTKGQGTGLGLTIAHRLIEANGGSLTGRNRPDGGAEFVVVLPTARDEKVDAAQDADRHTSAA